MTDCGCNNFPAGLGNVTFGGSVGIGMSPEAGVSLDVLGSLRAGGVRGGEIAIGNYYGGGNGIIRSLGGNIVFQTPNTTNVMTMLDGGAVGIGMMPEVRLDVAGDIRSSGGVRGGEIIVGNYGNLGGANIVTPVSGNADLIVRGRGTGNLLLNQGDGANVGIGTATPAAKLDVNGGIAASGAASVGGDLTVGGAVSATGPISALAGGGDLNVRARGSGHLLLNYGDGANVGIGKANPTAKLDVNGDLAVSGNGTVSGDLTVGGSVGYSGMITAGLSGADLNVRATGSGNLLLNTGDGANVGVGKASPAVKLDVAGGIAASGNVDVKITTPGNPLHIWSSNQIAAASAAGLRIGQHNSDDEGHGKFAFMGMVDNPSPGPNKYFYIQTVHLGSGGIYPDIVLQPTSGKVGIGKLNPQADLDVDGDLAVSGSVGVAGQPAGDGQAGLTVGSADSRAGEGGEILLKGKTGQTDWRIDNFYSNFRLHKGGVTTYFLINERWLEIVTTDGVKVGGNRAIDGSGRCLYA